MNRWLSLVTHDWRQKLMSLVLATLLWLFIRHSINYSPTLAPLVPPPPPPPAARMARPTPGIFR